MTSINLTKKTDLFKIDPRNIVVEEGFNCRVDYDLDFLIESIRENGVKEPITVIRLKDEEGNEKYKLVNGHRRYYATMKLLEEGVDIPRIPAMIIPKTDDITLLTEQILRNEGKPFNEYELGIACQKYLALGLKKSDIAKKLSKNPGCITYYLDHFSRDQRIQDMLRENKISGAEVRRIYKEHKEDEAGAVDEILNGAKKAEKTGKKKVTCKDLEIDGKTRTARASNDIKVGLTKLMYYFEKYSKDREINLDLEYILEELNKGETIDNIFLNYNEQYRQAE